MTLRGGRNFYSRPTPDHAGLRVYGNSLVVNATVGLYDGELAGLDTEGGRWQTVCETHGAIASHSTFKHARQFLPFPHEWCEECRAEYERRHPWNHHAA